MSKNPNRTPSVSQRRQEAQRRQEEQRRRMLIVGGALLAVAVLAVAAFFLTRNTNEDASGTSGDTTSGTEMSGERPLAALEPAARNNYYDSPPPQTIDTEKDYEAIIRLAKGGEIRLRLFDDEAPVTVNNFVFLANQGFYDGTTFHRVLEDFMAQGGDPSGTGSGGPGYTFADETDNGLTFDRAGLLAMANAGPNTNGSQFFITFEPTPHLNGAHTIFGEVIAGSEVLDTITRRDPSQGPDTPGDEIAEIVIVEK